MAFFGLFGKKKDKKVKEVAKVASNTTKKESKSNLSTSKPTEKEVINLNKRTELFEEICLDKGFNEIARVALVLDFSSSMMYQYSNGTVQEVVERLLPAGVKFDDNAAIDVYIFAERENFHDLGEVSDKDFHNYVNREVYNGNYRLGGTTYAPIINYITEKYTNEPGDPAFVMFITDGDTWDEPETSNAIKKAAKKPIFWQFIGLGDDSMSFLEKLDTMDGRVVDNANFQRIKDINKISDNDLYEKVLMSEFPEWWEKAKKLKIIK